MTTGQILVSFDGATEPAGGQLAGIALTLAGTVRGPSRVKSTRT